MCGQTSEVIPGKLSLLIEFPFFIRFLVRPLLHIIAFTSFLTQVTSYPPHQILSLFFCDLKEYLHGLTPWDSCFLVSNRGFRIVLFMCFPIFLLIYCNYGGVVCVTVQTYGSSCTWHCVNFTFHKSTVIKTKGINTRCINLLWQWISFTI